MYGIGKYHPKFLPSDHIFHKLKKFDVDFSVADVLHNNIYYCNLTCSIHKYVYL